MKEAIRRIVAAALCMAAVVVGEVATAQERTGLALTLENYRPTTGDGTRGMMIYAHCNADGTLFAWGPSWSNERADSMVRCSGPFRVELVYALSHGGEIQWDNTDHWEWPHEFKTIRGWTKEQAREACGGTYYWPLAHIIIAVGHSQADWAHRPGHCVLGPSSG